MNRLRARRTEKKEEEKSREKGCRNKVKKRNKEGRGKKGSKDVRKKRRRKEGRKIGWQKTKEGRCLIAIPDEMSRVRSADTGRHPISPPQSLLICGRC